MREHQHFSFRRGWALMDLDVLGLGQRLDKVIQEASSVHVSLGLPVDGCEWSGLGPDSFNLMPIIEHH